MAVLPASDGLVNGSVSLVSDNTWTGINTYDNQVQWSVGADVDTDGVSLPGIIKGNYADVNIVSGTNINSIDTTGHPGTIVRYHFNGAIILEHSETFLALPGKAPITTAAGDEFTFIEYEFNKFRCTVYTPATPIDLQGVTEVKPGTNIAVVDGTTTPTVSLDDNVNASGIWDMDGHTLRTTQGSNLAIIDPATSIEIPSTGNFFEIDPTGTPNLTSFTFADTPPKAGIELTFLFQNAVVLIDNTGLIQIGEFELPGGNNIDVAAGDIWRVVYVDENPKHFRTIAFTKEDGTSIVGVTEITGSTNVTVTNGTSSNPTISLPDNLQSQKVNDVTLQDTGDVTTFLNKDGEYTTPPGTGLQAVVDDLTPQLGGILDSNEKMVRWSQGSTLNNPSGAIELFGNGNFYRMTSGSGGTITDITFNATNVTIPTEGTLILFELIPGSANIIFDANAGNIKIPASTSITAFAGDFLWFLADDGNFNLINIQRTGSLSTLADDTTPQLGGELDTNSKTVVFSQAANQNIVDNAIGPIVGGNTIDIAGTGPLKFIAQQKDGFTFTLVPTAAFTIEHGASSPPVGFAHISLPTNTSLDVVSGDVLNFVEDGSIFFLKSYSLDDGASIVGVKSVAATTTDNQEAIIISGTSDEPTVGVETTKPTTQFLSGDGTYRIPADNAGVESVTVTPGDNAIVIDNTDTANPTVGVTDQAGSGNYLDGNGDYSVPSGTGLQAVVDDGDPKLGGDLDTNGKVIAFSYGVDQNITANALGLIVGGNTISVGDVGGGPLKYIKKDRDGFKFTLVVNSPFEIEHSAGSVPATFLNIDLPGQTALSAKTGDVFNFEQDSTRWFIDSYTLLDGASILGVKALLPGTNISVLTTGNGSPDIPEVNVFIQEPLETNNHQIRESAGSQIQIQLGDTNLPIPDNGNYFRVGAFEDNQISIFDWGDSEPTRAGTKFTLSFDRPLLAVTNGLNFNIWDADPPANIGGQVGVQFNLLNGSAVGAENITTFQITTVVGVASSFEFDFVNTVGANPSSEALFEIVDPSDNVLASFQTNGSGKYQLSFIPEEAVQYIVRWTSTTDINGAEAGITLFDTWVPFTLVHSAFPVTEGELFLPTLANITVGFGDVATFIERDYDIAQSFLCVDYMRGDGSALSQHTGSGVVDKVIPGTNISVDSTNAADPIVSVDIDADLPMNNHTLVTSKGSDVDTTTTPGTLILEADGNYFDVAPPSPVQVIKFITMPNLTSSNEGMQIQIHSENVSFTIDSDVLNGNIILPNGESIDVEPFDLLEFTVDLEDEVFILTNIQRFSSLSTLKDDSSPELAGNLDTFGHMILGARGSQVQAVGIILTPEFDGHSYDVIGGNFSEIASSGVIGTQIELHFQVSLVLGHGAKLKLPNDVDLTTEIDDIGLFEQFDNQSPIPQWRLVSYLRKSGQPLESSSNLSSNMNASQHQIGWSKGVPVDNSTGSPNHIDISAADGNYFDLTTVLVDQLITAFIHDPILTPTGTVFKIHFLNDVELFEGATLNLPLDANLFVKEFDIAEFVVEGDDLVRLTTYTPFSGEAIVTKLENDPSPTLGGDLDANNHLFKGSRGSDITNASLSVITLQSDGNYYVLVNAGLSWNTIEFVGLSDAFLIGFQFTIEIDAGVSSTNVLSGGNLILPKDESIVAKGGDVLTFAVRASGSVKLINYQSDGQPALGGGYTLLETKSMTGLSVIEFQNSLGGDFKEWKIIIEDGRTSGAGDVSFRSMVGAADSDSSYSITGYTINSAGGAVLSPFNSGAIATEVDLNGNLNAGAGQPCFYTLTLKAPSGRFTLFWEAQCKNSIAQFFEVRGAASLSATGHNGFQILRDSGTFTLGSISLWGLP